MHSLKISDEAFETLKEIKEETGQSYKYIIEDLITRKWTEVFTNH